MPLTKFYLSLALFGLVLLSSAAFSQSTGRISFNEGWLFQRNDPPEAEGKLSYSNIKDWVRLSGNDFSTTPFKPARPNGNLGEDIAYTNAGFDDAAWRKLDLPHDWAIEGDFQYDLPGETGKRPYVGVGWYRKHFQVSPYDRDKNIFIDFDGAMSYPAVWLNGKFVGGWAYGYSSFRLDLTPYIEYGKENVISVRLENLPESSRWYPGAGIYRNVWLVETASVHISQWGTYITTPHVDPSSATVNVQVSVDNGSAAKTEFIVQTQIFEIGPDNKKRGRVIATSDRKAVETAAGSSQKSETQLKVANPKPWNTKTPNRYIAITNLQIGGRTIESYETKFGIRTIKFDAERGFVLNGELVDIKGVCLHHDLGAIGTAVNIRATDRQIEIMKSMGANAIRTSHNPPSPELLDLADKMGILIMDEAFDAWVTQKKDNDYHVLFADWHEKDLRSMVRRDRNHPSVVLWSIGNEIPDTKKPEGAALAASLRQTVREEDMTRPVTSANDGVETGYSGYEKSVDIFGYNYKPNEYGKFREKNPEIPLIGSETVSSISSRGEYYFPAPNSTVKGNVMVDFQVTSYDFQTPSWAVEFAGQERNPAVAGEFVWTGFDYLGEPAPYDKDLYWVPDISDPVVRADKERDFKARGQITVPSRSSYFGIVDLCGFPKDRYYAYQAEWRPELPIAHIFPHWNWPERVGLITPVEVYTSGDEAELFLNGKSLGRKKMEPFRYRIEWMDVIYQPGELKVVAYKNGVRWAEDIVRTTGDAYQIAMTAARNSISSDGRDLSFITVSITDKNGMVVPTAKNRIRFSIGGAGEIAAVDNGDATDLESFQSTNRRTYNGLALVVVHSLKNKKGPIRLKAESDGIKPTEIKLQSTK